MWLPCPTSDDSVNTLLSIIFIYSLVHMTSSQTIYTGRILKLLSKSQMFLLPIQGTPDLLPLTNSLTFPTGQRLFALVSHLLLITVYYCLLFTSLCFFWTAVLKQTSDIGECTSIIFVYRVNAL
jgi:hypothetical protein